MNRCTSSTIAPLLLAAAALLVAAAAALPTAAQAQRMFPMKVQRGTITFTGTREAVVNDKTEKLAPGVVVRTERNTVALSGALRGKTFTVNFVRDPMGLVREVWILTPAEAARPLRNGQTASTPNNSSDGATYGN